MKIKLTDMGKVKEDTLGISLKIREIDIDKMMKQLKPYLDKEIDIKEVLMQVINKELAGNPFKGFIKKYIKRLKI